MLISIMTLFLCVICILNEMRNIFIRNMWLLNSEISAINLYSHVIPDYRPTVFGRDFFLVLKSEKDYCWIV